MAPLTAGRTIFFFFNDTATTEIYTLSLHDALPICRQIIHFGGNEVAGRLYSPDKIPPIPVPIDVDRKSTRLNSSHLVISYAVFCLKNYKRVREHHGGSPGAHGPLRNHRCRGVSHLR